MVDNERRFLMYEKIDSILWSFPGFGLDLNLTINSDMETIVRAMAEPDSGLDIRDRIWLKMPIPRSFLGKIRTSISQQCSYLSHSFL